MAPSITEPPPTTSTKFARVPAKKRASAATSAAGLCARMAVWVGASHGPIAARAATTMRFVELKSAEHLDVQ